MRRPSWIQRIIAILLIGGLYVFMAWTFATGAEDASPLEVVKNTVGALKKAAGNKAEIRRLILERMDLYEMGRRSMGRNWKNLSEAQRKEYLAEFAKYVEVFYRRQIFESVEFINSVDIRYLKVSITFKLHFAGGMWKVYDITAENISQVSNMRAQFDRIIAAEKFEGLLRRLREKIKELDK